MKYQTLSLLFLMSLLGCDSSTTTVEDVSDKVEVDSSVRPEKVKSPPEFLDPVYRPVIVNMENLQAGSSSSTRFSTQKTSANTTVTHGATLGTGQPDESVKVTWTYLKTDEQGDHYHFEKTKIDKSSQQKMMSKEIQYTGKKQLIFEDDFQRTWISPAPVEKAEPDRN